MRTEGHHFLYGVIVALFSSKDYGCRFLFSYIVMNYSKQAHNICLCAIIKAYLYHMSYTL